MQILLIIMVRNTNFKAKKNIRDTSPDIEWVKWFLKYLLTKNSKCDAFSILRPTSPIRSYKTIREAVNKFYNSNKTDSLRAVEKCNNIWKNVDTQKNI